METFEDLYNLWPNKRDKANTKLAYDYVFGKNNYSPLDYIKAAKLWIAKASDWLKEHQSLANWLRDEKFREELDEISKSGNLENALEHAQMFKDAAVVVCGEWNRLRNKWWASIEDIKGRQTCVEQALRDEFWQRNWPKALNLAVRIFEYSERDSIGNIKLIPNIEWFCDLKERMVAKIIEGYWGHPAPKHVIEHHEPVRYQGDDLKEITAMVEATKAKIKSGGDEPWKIRSSLTTVSLLYVGKPIETHPMPMTRVDQDALKATLQAKADQFNSAKYTPDLVAQHKFSEAQASHQPPNDNPKDYESLLDI